VGVNRSFQLFSACNQARILHAAGMMRISKVAALLALVWINGSMLAQDNLFPNRTATFTNLQGAGYTNVMVVKADLDGIIWREGSSGGRVCYTNLDPALLKEWGIPLERIEIARLRAGHKAVSDAQYRAARDAQNSIDLQAQQDAKARWNAEAPARAREAQRQADLEAIKAFEAQIEEADSQARHASAVTPVAASGDPAYVGAVMAQRAQVNSAIEDVNDAKKKLRRMKADYAEKYSK
jgi:hypothetical protein